MRGDKRSGLQRMTSIDWLGTALLLGSVTCLVLASSWGPRRGWNDGSVIATLVLFPVLLIITICWEAYLGDKAMIPLKVFRKISFSAIVATQLSSRWVMLAPIYYLPLFFEAVWDSTATSAGLRLLGVILSLVIASTVLGGIVRKTGRYTYFLIAGPCLVCVACGLMYTIDQTSSFGKIIGFEIILGVGIGCYMQMGMLAAQAEFAKEPAVMSRAMVSRVCAGIYRAKLRFRAFSLAFRC